MSYKLQIKRANFFSTIVFLLLLSCSYKVTAQINFICTETDCSNEIDDDGDGYIDCHDLDCVYELRPDKPKKQRSADCYNLTESCVNYLAAFIADPANDQWIQENLDVWEWGLSFMAEYGCTEEIGSFVRDALILKKADEEINLDRIEELYLTMIADPYALLAGCPDFDPQTYQDLLNLQIPNSINDLLASYGNCPVPPIHPNGQYTTLPCFSIQTIGQGTSTMVNMDYYAVEITQLPDFDNNGPDTEEEIYQKFRDNFTSLVSGMTTIIHTNCPTPPWLHEINASWTFMPYDPDVDPPFWESKTIGARFFIDADATQPTAQLIADDGAVITIQENEFTFIVATLVTPLSGTQPFAGKRMWGIRENENGNLEIFTRAIDRALPLAVVRALALFPGYFGCDEADYFEIADRTWLNFQDKLKSF